MTRLVNDPATFSDEALHGLVSAYPQYVTRVRGGVIRPDCHREAGVAVVVGGGSGHYPAFPGWVGPGLASGAVCGKVFASPSAAEVYSVVTQCDSGAGVLLVFGNYAGDVLNFTAAVERLRTEGRFVRVVTVSDDVASAPRNAWQTRRGVAGDLLVAKVAGAAAARGLPLDSVWELAMRANQATRTIGVAFGGCTLPGADAPLFALDPGTYALGMGIHGERGLETRKLNGADDVASAMLGSLKHDGLVSGVGDVRVAMVVNGLGSTTQEELLLLSGLVQDGLTASGFRVVAPVVGEQVTSLDMSGVSLSVMVLDDDLLPLWLDPCESPAFHRGAIDAEGWDFGSAALDVQVPELVPAQETEVSDTRNMDSAVICAVLEVVDECCRANARAWGDLDSVAGDGDHGAGMQSGVAGALAAARKARDCGQDPEAVLAAAGEGWAEAAGGTSGAIWRSMLVAAARNLAEVHPLDALTVRRALIIGARAAASTGGAVLGDKTIVDATEPFARVLEDADPAIDLGVVMRKASVAARHGASGTAGLIARKGRARTHGRTSVGHPDPGATSFADIVEAAASFPFQRQGS